MSGENTNHFLEEMEMTNVTAIKRFFESQPHGRKVEIAELKALSAEEKTELGKMCCAALGEEWEPAPTK